MSSDKLDRYEFIFTLLKGGSAHGVYQISNVRVHGNIRLISNKYEYLNVIPMHVEHLRFRV